MNIAYLYKILFLLIYIFIFPRSYTQDKRLALVIGNGLYELGYLANPENDAKAISNKLTSVGFEILEYTNLNQKSMKIVIDEFG